MIFFFCTSASLTSPFRPDLFHIFFTVFTLCVFVIYVMLMFAVFGTFLAEHVSRAECERVGKVSGTFLDGAMRGFFKKD